MTEAALDLARTGDGDAFAALVASHSRELHVHCYRLLGSVTDADDVLQETLLAAWRGLDGFAGRSSLRAWLYRIATNRCLNFIRDGRRRPPLEPVPPFEPPAPSCRGDVTWLQPYPGNWLDHDPALRHETRETIRLAFVAALQRITPRQAAAVVLCDALGFARVEVADMLDTTEAAVKGLVQRARATLARDVAPDGAPAAGSRAESAVAQRFAAAYAADDVDGVVALLTDDAWLAMPPAPHEYHGAAAIAGFLRASAAGRAGHANRLRPCRANGQPAFACSLLLPGEQAPRPVGVVVLTLDGERVHGITRFLGTVAVPFHADGAAGS